MPAKSAAQQKAAGAALAAKRGETSPSSLKGAAKEMYSSMSEQELEEFASTKRKGKPEHASKSRSRS
jgi:2-methylcitrate dehydratase PrpD